MHGPNKNVVLYNGKCYKNLFQSPYRIFSVNNSFNLSNSSMCFGSKSKMVINDIFDTYLISLKKTHEYFFYF